MKYWSKNMENKFIKLYKHNTDDEVARIMKVTHAFVIKKAEELGLEKEEPSKREWTDEEVKFIKATYSDQPNADIARALGVQKWQVEHIAYRLGLRKSAAYMAERVPADGNTLVDDWFAEWSGELNRSKGHFLTGKVLKHLFPHHRIEEEQPIGKLWLDWLIPQLGIAVEVHGAQHLQFNQHFHSTKQDFEKGQENDYAKSEMLESQNISLVVIYHDEKVTINLIKQKLEEII